MSSSGAARIIGPSSAATRCSPMKNDDSPYMRWKRSSASMRSCQSIAVLREVEVLRRPLLALPQLVELAVARAAATRRGRRTRCSAGSLVAWKSARSVRDGCGGGTAVSMAGEPRTGWLASQDRRAAEPRLACRQILWTACVRAIAAQCAVCTRSCRWATELRMQRRRSTSSTTTAARRRLSARRRSRCDHGATERCCDVRRRAR